MPLVEIKDKARGIKFARLFCQHLILTGADLSFGLEVPGCELDIAFGAPAGFFGLCFFDLLFEATVDLGEGEGLGSAA
jgi:hypothetical protein